MANKKLFQTKTGKFIPHADALNEAMAPSYAFSAKHALAQYAVTGCLNSTFYANADEQLAMVVDLCRRVDADFIARTAIYARERGRMKDMPALLCAILSLKNQALFKAVFPRIIDNGKMLRNFVQIMRSGVIGRKSLGTSPKRMVGDWFESRTEEEVFMDSVAAPLSSGYRQNDSSETEDREPRRTLRLLHRSRSRCSAIAADHPRVRVLQGSEEG
jgi:60 kDa SS-A/Ro ribonucleoprotein